MLCPMLLPTQTLRNILYLGSVSRARPLRAMCGPSIRQLNADWTLM